MQAHLARGVSAAQAAALGRRRREPGQEPSRSPRTSDARSSRALVALDDAGAQAAFDDLLARYSLDGILRDVVLPYLHELGERWSRGDGDVGQEHFASTLLRGRLLGLARGWDQGLGPRAVLACAPGELHDLSLIVFGLALRRHGWRITLPRPGHAAARSSGRSRTRSSPELVVVVAIAGPRAGPASGSPDWARRRPLALAGPAVGEGSRATRRAPAVRRPGDRGRRIAQALTARREPGRRQRQRRAVPG